MNNNNNNNNNLNNGVVNTNPVSNPIPTPTVNNQTPSGNTILTNDQPMIDNNVNNTSIDNRFIDVSASSSMNNNMLSNSNNVEINSVSQPTMNSPIQQTSGRIQSNNINFIDQNNPSQSINIQSSQNNGYINQQQINNSNNSASDEELLRAFIGNNYDKITTKPFNFAGFFFSTFYMFYRKMFLYGILLFLVNIVVLNIINNFFVTILFNVVVGLFVNKIYLYYAKKKIKKIKLENSQNNIDGLRKACSAKGGTSVGRIFLGFFAEIGITFVVLIIILIAGFGSVFVSLFNLENWDITINGNKIDANKTNDSTLVENITVGGYSCLNSKCNVSIQESDNNVDYVFNAKNSDLFNILSDYSDYVKVDIYYTQKNNEKTIVDYKLFLKTNNEDISDVKNEDELRNIIGLYTIGTHTETFKLKETGMTGYGYKDDESYIYIEYTLVDSKNNEYEMKYIIENGSNEPNLVEGNNYTITFEVSEDSFGYEFHIKSIN